jgi:DNA polymerase III alpha subunit
MGSGAAGVTGSPGSNAHARTWRLPVLVSSREGYRHLCRVITQGHLRAAKREARYTPEDFAGMSSGLVALVGREALRADRHGVGGLLDRLIGIFGRANVWIALERRLQHDDQADPRGRSTTSSPACGTRPRSGGRAGCSRRTPSAI